MTLPCHNGYNYNIQQDTVITEWDLICQNEGKGELTQSMVTFGQLFAAVIFLPLADRLCDESLRWLVANGKMKEAQKLIQKIAKKNNKDPDKIVPLLTSLDSEVENNAGYEKDDIHVTSVVNPVTSKSSNKPTVISIFRNAFMCKIALIWMFTWFTNGMTYYGLLFSSVQLEGSRFLNYFVNGLVEYPSCVVFAIMINMNSISRKKLTIGFHLLAGIPMILSVVLISFREKHEIFVKLAIACSFIAKTGIAGSYNTIFIYTPETFPTNLRNMGLGLGAFGSHIGGVIAPFATLLV
ncbi:SLC22A4_5 [Mytilus coruscus]|uniref:SLC22A4_5 n=1 Tax=Mytilus coruscus TaxID=42192 RepID=A0A6J8EZM7_MYTCO|nr:SLC22A4_5 [Mytilus coruscus]